VFADAPTLSIDHCLWSEKRFASYLASLRVQFPPPLAVLRVPRVGIEVPVFEGTDDSVLDRGAGHISETALPGQLGNVGIAGHRDGFFRGLKDIAVGDLMTLTTPREEDAYTVDGITIVTPDDTGVLDPAPTPTVTLVTCYPFYFVGPAPQRYIVRCSLKQRLKDSISLSGRKNGPMTSTPGG